MSAPVFLAESTDLAAYREGDTYYLDGAEGRHAGVVQRRSVGEAIDIVDGHGTRLSCTITHVSGEHLDLLVTSVSHESCGQYRLTLVQALAKGDRDELAIEAATEVGVDRVIPWQADRSIVVWRGARAAKSHARWVATVRSAMKQARRARLPMVDQPVTSQQLVDVIAETTQTGGVVYVLHESATTALTSQPRPPGGEELAPVDVVVVVGPEGGISDSELEKFTAAGAQAVLLGPHVLRTSTAGPVALALLSASTGRW